MHTFKSSIRNMTQAVIEVRHFAEYLAREHAANPRAMALVKAVEPFKDLPERIAAEFEALPALAKEKPVPARTDWEGKSAKSLLEAIKAIKAPAQELKTFDPAAKLVTDLAGERVSSHVVFSDCNAIVHAESVSANRDAGAYFTEPFRGMGVKRSQPSTSPVHSDALHVAGALQR